MAGQLVPSRHVSEADWYDARLNGFGGRVDQIVPSGYPAYARILHPATNEGGVEVAWSDVAAARDTVLHPSAQFHAIAGRRTSEPGSPTGWPGEDPDVGTLTPQQLRVLCEILAGHTATPERCWLTVWEGLGSLPQQWRRTARRVHRPHRAFYIFQRPLAEVFEFSVQVERIGWDQHPRPSSMGRMIATGPPAEEAGTPNRVERRPEAPARIQSPNQWWPQDRAWCVASEIDFDSTIVAGSEDLVADIIAHPGVEAFAVSPTDDLTFEGDEINAQPPR